uniref:Uncharacterized protein n=1 Tax=Arundo donax TaxID=35708 RepID=A0A0A9E1A4_ARUDO
MLNTNPTLGEHDTLTTRISHKKGQTQCWKLPHKVGSGEGLYEASLTPALCNAERLHRTQDLLAQSGVTYHYARPALPQESHK